MATTALATNGHAIALTRRSDAKKTKLLRVGRGISPVTASTARHIIQTTVVHPRVPGATERVPRVIDTVEQLWRCRQFGKDPAQAKRRHDAAIIYRAAWDMVRSSIGGVMDFDRIRGSCPSGAPPAPPYLRAANYLRQAEKKLYAFDNRIIKLVIGVGHNFIEVARMVHGDPSKGETEQIGDRFRFACDELAIIWIGPEHEHAALRTWRPPESVPHISDSPSIMPLRVAHGSLKGVKISGEN